MGGERLSARILPHEGSTSSSTGRGSRRLHRRPLALQGGGRDRRCRQRNGRRTRPWIPEPGLWMWCALESIAGADQACVTTGRGGMTGASLNCQFRGCRAHARVLSSPLTTRCSARRSVVFRASGEFNLVGPANGHTAAAGQSLMRSLTRSSSTTWTNPSGRSSCCGRFERRSDGRRPRAQHAPQRGLARPALTRIEQRRVEPSSRPWGKGTVASPNNTHR